MTRKSSNHDSIFGIIRAKTREIELPLGSHYKLKADLGGLHSMQLALEAASASLRRRSSLMPRICCWIRVRLPCSSFFLAGLLLFCTATAHSSALLLIVLLIQEGFRFLDGAHANLEGLHGLGPLFREILVVDEGVAFLERLIAVRSGAVLKPWIPAFPTSMQLREARRSVYRVAS